MRKPLSVSFCLLLLLSALSAQVYHPFPTGVAEWSSQGDWWDPFSPNPTWSEVENFHLEGDTVLQGKQYKKLWEMTVPQFPSHTADFIGGIREDSTHTVYFFPVNDTMEYLLYRFGMQVGDTVETGVYNVHNNFPQPYWVAWIDSIQVNGVNRARYMMDGGPGLGGEYWIEGIGSVKGLLFPYDKFEFENIWQLNCFREDSLSVYPPGMTGLSTCFLLVGTEENRSSLELEVFPNPGDGEMIVQGLPDSGGLLEVFDLQGRTVLRKPVGSGSECRLDLRKEPKGLYLLKFAGPAGVGCIRVMIQ